MSEEVWKKVTIPEFEDFYQVSNYGHVKRIAGGSGAIPGHHLQPKKERPYGHLCVNLSTRNRTKMVMVHTLVLSAFGKTCPGNNFQCCHADGDPQNNHIDNLRWGTAKENAADREAHGRHPHGVHSRNAKLTDEIVRQIRKARTSERLSYTQLGNRFGINPSTARAVVKGLTWAHIN